MGLDITAYSQLKAAPHASVDADGYPDDWHQFCRISEADISGTEKSWPGRTEGVVPPGVYSFGQSHRFRAGSYSGFNAWRDELAKRAGYGHARAVWNDPDGFSGKPFVELINFSDCEGIIGPVVAKKLAGDFSEFEGLIGRTGSPDADWFMPLYREWHKAFEIAADGGAVDFH